MRQAIRFIAALAVAAFVSGCSSNGGGGSIPGSNGAGKSILSYGAGESIPTTSTVCPPGVATGGASLGLPATSKPPYTTRWGFEVHSLDTTPLPAIAATGATFVRMDLAPNFALNPDGSPNWAAYDSFVQNAQACGLGILFVGPYLYAPSSIPSGTPPCTPGSLCPYITSASQYDAFLEAVATRYSGHGIMYELGPNEPDSALRHYLDPCAVCAVRDSGGGRDQAIRLDGRHDLCWDVLLRLSVGRSTRGETGGAAPDDSAEC